MSACRSRPLTGAPTSGGPPGDHDDAVAGDLPLHGHQRGKIERFHSSLRREFLDRAVPFDDPAAAYSHAMVDIHAPVDLAHAARQPGSRRPLARRRTRVSPRSRVTVPTALAHSPMSWLPS
jgi:hypothetical protein